MDNKNLSFSGEELRKLSSKRLMTLLSILLTIIAYIGVLYYIFVKQPSESEIKFIVVMALVLLIWPSASCYRYYSAIKDIVYRIIHDNYGWEIFADNSEYDNIRNLYQFHLKDFGLLPNDGYVNFDNNIKGKTENTEFILQEVSWEVPKMSRHGKTYGTAEEYILLTVDTPFPINCNILIKKNKILKWGIQKLSRVKIENKEFEKYYDVYSDAPATAFNIINQDFIRDLLYHKKINNNLVELIITPDKVFLHQRIKGQLFYLEILMSPMALCQKKIEEINAKLNILPVLNSLKNK